VVPTTYDAFMIALALGVSGSAGGNRTRIVGGLLLTFSLLGVTWPLCLDAQRQVLVTGGVMLADTGPLILAIVTVALIDGRVCSVVQTAVTGSGRLRERGEDDQSTRPRPPRCKRFVRPQHG
jgi:hypothetical protein